MTNKLKSPTTLILIFILNAASLSACAAASKAGHQAADDVARLASKAGRQAADDVARSASSR